MKYIKILSLGFLMMAWLSCTKLDEKFRGELEQSNSSAIPASELLTSAYNALNGPYQGDGPYLMLSEHPSDEMIAPTRGPDWDDNGQWRALHAHTWNADHGIVSNGFSALLSIEFAASNVLEFNPSAQQAAEARFIRALSMYDVLDGWNQVPFRENLTDYRELPITLSGADAADFIASELNAIINDLPDNGPTAAFVANKNAAKFLLMKLFLNKGAFANRENPTFDGGDMAQVIALADQIIGSGKYSLETGVNFYDNFAPNNDAVSSENIFTLFNENGERGGNVRGAWFSIAHYNMNPGGWNGFSTLSDFYDKFEAADIRRNAVYDYPGALPNPGNRQTNGFLIGQQYNLTTDAPLETRKQGQPLIFLPEVHLRETGDDLERAGIRGLKYSYDYSTSADVNNNDWVIFRYADVLLMKAEALLRTGDADGALDIVNDIRAARGASALGTLTLDGMLDERGFEMYWEGWRRQDLIRFGKYLQLWQEKVADDPKYLLFPIPNSQLAVNPNLVQNPGY